MSSFKPPQCFVPGANPAEEWDRWKQRFNIYYDAADIGSKPVKQQRATLLHVIGEAGLELYNTLTIEEEDDERTVPVILAAITQFYRPYRNTTYTRYVFFTAVQAANQSIDEFITELKTKAKICEFGALTDSLIRDRLVCGLKDDILRERLLQETDLSLITAIDLCRAKEKSKQQNQTMSNNNSTESQQLHTITKNRFPKTSRGATNSNFHAREKPTNNSSAFMKPSRGYEIPQKQRPSNPQQQQQTCSRCATHHKPKQCPAYGQQCNKCGKLNHYARVCKANKLHCLLEEENGSNENLFLGSVTAVSEIVQSNEWCEIIEIGNQAISFKIDTGSQINVIPLQVHKQLNPIPGVRATKKVVTAYSGHRLEIIGECKLFCKTKSGSSALCDFSVIDTESPAILGLKSAEELQLFARLHSVADSSAKQSAQEIIDRHSDVFKGIGKIPGQHHITLNENAVPKVHSARRIPFTLKDKVKQELQRMQDTGIIVKIDEPTEWVNPIVIVSKPNGSVRICMDPRDLNEAIKREHFQLPTQETVFSKLDGAKVFTVLDASSAFWQIELDEYSSKLCTIATPFGRFRFLRLPYGIKSAPEVFQKTMDRLYSSQEGSFPYFDDLLVWGKDSSEHDERLEHSLNIARENNVKFGRTKLQLAESEVDYIGHKISKEGIKIQNSKVEAIEKLQVPTSRKELQRFLGMVNYLAKFIPNQSSHTSYLRSLLNKHSCWTWDAQAQLVFDKLKQLISTAPVLAFYSPGKEITLSVDASSHGLGAVMLQEKRPISYASASLTTSQKNYAQIEKELLAIVYACECFHFYIYGREVTIETDHKPLLAIMKKPMENLSPRIQRMVLRLQRYTIRLVHVPGKELHVADTLSRDTSGESVNTDYLDSESYAVHSMVSATEETLRDLKDSNALDKVMQCLVKYIQEGWPSKISSVPVEVKPYWAYREELHQADGMIFRGQRLIIPESCRAKILAQIHSAHQGINICKAKAREAIFWPGVSKDIEKVVQVCKVCQQYAPANQHEPLHPHPVPSRPWSKVGIDFMKLKSDTFLVVVDYHSKFAEIQVLSTTTANTVVTALKSVFARHGIPDTLISDNGPPFNSEIFKRFTQSWQIEHNTSSPEYPRSNGMVERTIQTLKGLLSKAEMSKQDPYLALLEYRASSTNGLSSPACMLMGRKLRTLLPVATTLLEPKFDTSETVKKLENNQEKQKAFANQKSKPLTPISVGSRVLISKGHRNWENAKVVRVSNAPRSYVVEKPNGKQYRRNRYHLRQDRSVDVQESNQASNKHVTERESEFSFKSVPITSRDERVGPSSHDFTKPPQLPMRNVSTKEQILVQNEQLCTTPQRENTRSVQCSPVKELMSRQTRHGRILRTPQRFKD